MRATKGLKTPGMAMGCAAQACRRRWPAETKEFTAGEVGCTPGLAQVKWGGKKLAGLEYFMATHEERQPSLEACTGAAPPPLYVGLSRFWRFSLVLGIVLILALGGFLLYQRWYRNRFENDPALMAELEGARLVDGVETEALPGDWPQWRGPRRDGVSLETGLNWNWPEGGPRLLWEAKASEGFSGFAVAA